MIDWPFIYLASASPRRHEILTQMGVSHTVLRVPPPEGEDEPQLLGEAPEDYVIRTAHEKAERAIHWLAHQNDLPPAPVLASDTTVILQGEILGKPTDLIHAAEMLQRLSGNTHEVRTAVVLMNGRQCFSAVSCSNVTFAELSGDDIARYCATREPLGKAGSYGIQGMAGMFVRHLSGSYTGVMGLPMYETAQLLQMLFFDNH